MPVAGLLKSSSGRGRSLKELGGLATWLVEPEYSLRSVWRGVKGRLVSTVLNPVLGSLRDTVRVRAGEKIGRKCSYLVIAGNDPGRDMVALASSIISAEVFDWET